MKAAFFIVCFVATCAHGLFFGNSNKWDGLKVTWGLNPFGANTFSTLPRTVADATKDGFVQISQCGENVNFAGNRYVKNGDYSVVLLFDNNGFIAGQQAGIPMGNSTYPSRYIQPPFIADGQNYFMTAYFVDPSIICASGRSSDTFSNEGTGTDLYIQNGTNPLRDLLKIPKEEKDIGNSKWTKGKCFPTMGVHYWYDLRTDKDCNKMFPVFLLYNKGQLNAFGWAFITSLTSPRYEHPTPSVFGAFMVDVPTCLKTIGEISTMHIYLTSNPVLDLC